MTRQLLIALMITLGLTVSTFASEACCPPEAGPAATAGGNGTLPPGHPPMGGNLPPGHPTLPGGAMSGMGGMGGMGGGGQLPPGHPVVAGQHAEPFTASLTVRTQQGTAEAAAIASQTVKVVFHGRQGVVHQVSATLNERGTALIEDLKFNQPVQPVVTLEYQGATYQGTGHMINAAQPDSAVRIVAYESQDKPVDHEVAMRHVMLQRTADALHVTEIMAIRNGTDRAWIGQLLPETKPQADAEAQVAAHAAPKRATVAIALPPAAQGVALGRGFDVCCTIIESGQIVMTTPLLPGTHQYQFSYHLPVAAGQATLDLTSALTVRHLAVFVPDDGSNVAATGLTAGDVMEDGSQRVRTYMAMQLGAGQAARLTIGAPTQASSDDGATGGNQVKMAVGTGAAALLLAGLVVLFRPANSERNRHQA